MRDKSKTRVKEKMENHDGNVNFQKKLVEKMPSKKDRKSHLQKVMLAR